MEKPYTGHENGLLIANHKLMILSVVRIILGLFLVVETTKAQAIGLKSYARIIPQMLVDHGLSQIGDLNLKNLLNEIDTIKFEGTVEKILVGSGQPRFGCNYFIETRRVRCNLEETSVAVLPLLALHESMGALGYQDENYQLSSILNIYALSGLSYETSLLSQAFHNLQKRNHDEVYILAGGGTSVGGGGDSVGAAIKSLGAAIIFSLLKDPSLQPNQIKQIECAFERIMKLEIENDLDATTTQVSIIQTKSGFKALVPYKLWNFVQQNHAHLEKIKSYQVQIYDPIFEYAMRTP